MPFHILKLKVGVSVLLMRKLDMPKLCYGTRLQITHLGQNIVRVIIMTKLAKGINVLIPRIPIIPMDLHYSLKV